MIWIYRILFLPLLLVAAPYYLWRMRRRGGYAEGFWHRFGAVPATLPAKSTDKKRVWLQAVSVGEMLAITPLLEALQRDGVEVYLTTTTSTGYKLAKEKYAALVTAIGYFPLDFWAFNARAWRRVQPDLCVLMEGERWPEHVHQARRRGVPVVSVNARMSDKSFARSLRFRGAMRPLAAGMTQVLCSSKRDEERFRELGFSAEKLRTTGNLKLDVAITAMSESERSTLKQELGLSSGGLVLLGSSTWAGEEVALIAALTAARARGLAASLLLVPRHAERREELRGVLAKSGLRFHFRSEGAAAGEVDVAVGDTTGELRKFTQLADLVFTGKSLAPHEGGQTPVEAAVLGKPLLHGPRMSNFHEIIRTLTEAGAVRKVETHSELVSVAVELLQDSAQRERMATAARAWHAANRGATERTLAVLRAELARV